MREQLKLTLLILVQALVNWTTALTSWNRVCTNFGIFRTRDTLTQHIGRHREASAIQFCVPSKAKHLSKYSRYICIPILTIRSHCSVSLRARARAIFYVCSHRYSNIYLGSHLWERTSGKWKKKLRVEKATFIFMLDREILYFLCTFCVYIAYTFVTFSAYWKVVKRICNTIFFRCVAMEKK